MRRIGAVVLAVLMVSGGGCVRRSPPPSPLSPVSPISPLPMQRSASSFILYPLDLDLDTAALGPSDFPFIPVRYTLRTELQDARSRGVELRYPSDEDRFHPFVKGFAVELRLFAEAGGAQEAYGRRAAQIGGSPLSSTAADEAQWGIRSSEERPGEIVWVHEVVFRKGNLVGYLLVKWSERLEEGFLRERVDRILERVRR